MEPLVAPFTLRRMNTKLKKLASNSATENTTYYYANNEQLAKKNPDGTKTYVHNDHLGSSSVLTNSSGTVVENTTYDPWGEVKAGGTQDKFQYTGQEKDSETGLNYYNARYYNSHIRRFTQPDDVIANPYNPQELNRYSYVNNNPLTYTDPTGHFDVPVLGNIVDAGLTAYDAEQVIAEPKNPTNWVALGLDATAAVVPVVPDGAGEAVRVAEHGAELAAKANDAKVVNNASKAVYHGNDLRTTATTFGYFLRDITTKEIKKIGETTKGVTRYTQKFYIDNHVFMDKVAKGTKAQIHVWEHVNLGEYLFKFKELPKMNKSLH